MASSSSRSARMCRLVCMYDAEVDRVVVPVLLCTCLAHDHSGLDFRREPPDRAERALQGLPRHTPRCWVKVDQLATRDAGLRAGFHAHHRSRINFKLVKIENSLRKKIDTGVWSKDMPFTNHHGAPGASALLLVLILSLVLQADASLPLSATAPALVTSPSLLSRKDMDRCCIRLVVISREHDSQTKKLCRISRVPTPKACF